MPTDVSCRPIQPGPYLLTQPGTKPVAAEVFEDPVSTDLWLKTAKGTQRVDELSPDVLLHRMGCSESADAAASGTDRELLAEVEAVLRRAADARGTLRMCLVELGELLGCAQGDGSDLADQVFASVYDGTGSGLELVELAGGFSDA